MARGMNGRRRQDRNVIAGVVAGLLGGLAGTWAMTEFRSTSAWTMLAAINEIGKFDSSAWIRRVDVPTSVIVATTRSSNHDTRNIAGLGASIKCLRVVMCASGGPLPLVLLVSGFGRT